MKTWFWILGWFLSILTITGNSFITFLICKRRQLRTKTNAFVASLAVADFCVGMTVVPMLFILKEKDSETQKIQLYVRLIFVRASVTNLCSLVLDRFVAVVKPLKYMTIMTRGRVIQMVFLSWAFPAAFIAVRASLHFALHVRHLDNIFIWLDTFTFKLVPCVMLVSCFACMLSVICKHGRQMRTLLKQIRFNAPVCYRPQDNAAVKIMAIVIGVFLLCSAIRFHCGLSSLSHGKIDCDILSVKILITVLNSAVNPLAYAVYKRDVKKELKKMTRINF
ncbi:trace amine-associated receptor 3-like [Stylophora pistillata]|uniref:trace amine-associated receptor 3-like n=1 Tax=Stylophora pistillata TaxID=50429 RepID=UPI000C04BDC4|nr:trace amine-associated receptor 3-like [Stylophora pistillata]